MEITLEKIELVKDRTGATYKEAKEALEKTEGNVVDAIISIEETIDRPSATSVVHTSLGIALLEKMKEIVLRGNITKIIVKHNGKMIMDIPLNVGVVGVVIAPWGIIIGIITAMGFNCTIDMVKEDGTVICLSDKADTVVQTVKRGGNKVYGSIKEKAPAVAESVRTKGSAAAKKASAAAGTIKSGINKAADKIKNRDKEEPYTAEDFDAEWFENDEEFKEVIE